MGPDGKPLPPGEGDGKPKPPPKPVAKRADMALRTYERPRMVKHADAGGRHQLVLLKPLAKAAPRSFTPIQEAERAKLSAAFRKAFLELRDSVVEQYRDMMVKHASSGVLAKAGDETIDKPATGDPVEIAAALNLDPLSLVWDDATGVLEVTTEDGGKVALAKVSVDNPELVNVDVLALVNQDAVSWAREHAAELLGKDAAGGQIAESTRAMLARTIAQGMSQGMTVDEIAALLVEDYAFSDTRAQLIAETEVANASSNGQLLGYQGAGLKWKKWLLSNDEGVCLVCEANADEGWVAIDKAFPGGVQTPLQHPNCRCVIVARLKPPEE
jgi:uncharacterized protein with gpF-like domain